MIKEAIAKVVERIDLEEDEMAQVVDEMMEGVATEAQMAAFLAALRMKGEAISEITGAARIMIEKARKIVPEQTTVVDLCGTGGDAKGTFNVSTASSFIVAGAGVAVAKHGNRSVSSKSGSADVLEKLGVNINISPEGAELCLNETGIVFLFAPIYHPAMKNVAKPRIDIGIRSIFNVLGPITNPAGVKNQLMGVYSEVLLEPIAKVFRNLEYERAMIVHGSDTLDEITVTGKTAVAELKDGIVKKDHFDPADFGFKRRELEEIKGGNAKKNAKIILSILEGNDKEAKREISVLNAAAAILVANSASDMEEAIEMAEESIDSGKALAKLKEMAEFTTSWSDN